ncbi:transcription-repair coupling factor [Azospirillum canadense]|uniref:transcription-repair coupling factor n=1 Tax=Azospirillum canadense TaxID=403962 RepID=UPI002227B1D4|nr:DEAD/DEAH box helicase [Azospirillum canadense]MCW2236975.1 transcription-repair coupling factor (superfamily II helicase) [Azospirillum canadense]
MNLPEGMTDSGRRVLHGVPDGYDAWVLAELARRSPAGTVLHIAEDSRSMERLSRNLRRVATDAEILTFPAWDTLPYDRASPSARVAGRRIATLARLAQPTTGPQIVVTSVGGVLRRLPPADALADGALRLAADHPTDPESLRGWLFRNGYGPAAEARDPGDVLFGDDDLLVVDPGRAEPLRIPLPDARIDAELLPLSEVPLTEATMARFATAYLAAFGAEAEGDPLYQAVRAGRRYVGMEQWLPLFFLNTNSLFDRMPSAVLSMDEGTEAMRDARLEQARHAFESRKRQMAASEKAGLPAYRPLPPEDVFLDTAAWKDGLAGRAVVVLSGGEGSADAGGRPVTLAGDDEEDRVAGLRADQQRRVLIAVDDPGRAKGFARHLRREGVDAAVVEDAVGEQPIAVVALDLDAGFQAPGLAVVTAAEVLGEVVARPSRRRSRRLVDDLQAEAAELAPGNLVVHLDHGIGLTDGLEALEATGAPHDCLRVLYRDEAKSYVPVENLDQVWPFGAASGAAPLDRLGGSVWAQRRDSVADSLRVAAATLVRTQAERAMARTDPIRPDRRAYNRFADRFPHEETPDQQTAIDAVLRDLASGRLMDWLVCADVGFGKTEVALRAAFAVAMAGRQVAVVAPTTPLSHQHLEEFQERFAGFGVAIAELARNVSPSEAKAVKEGLKSGDIRIVIGTHALLSPGVTFGDLGLLVVDEEQRLGVKQKERLKAMAAGTHVLTLTATPIPRTLQLAMAGLRDLSVIATPPLRRRPVRTEFVPFDLDAVAEALRAERTRGGQAFYVCPRIEDLDEIRARLAAMVPEFRVIEAHGKMKPDALDDAMTAFADGAGDLLLATNIVETGLNIPNANTLIVHRADRFGLAQLHQLRGRVGRAAVQGRCWLTVEDGEELSEAARTRLQVLTRLDRPGAGFELAARDLGLRGAGDLLGEEQSGNLRDVGADLFQEMLRQAVEAARAGRPVPAILPPRVTLGQPVLIPDDYIRDSNLRLAVYRRLATLEDPEEREAFAAVIADRYGPLPETLETLMDLGALKCLSREAGVAALDIGPNGALFAFADDTGPDDDALGQLVERRQDLKRRPDGRLVLVAGDRGDEDFRRAVRRLLRDLVRLRKAQPPVASEADSVKPQAARAARM